jgi:hypothetical protein
LRFRHRIQIAHRAIMPALRGVGQIRADLHSRPLIQNVGKTGRSRAEGRGAQLAQVVAIGSQRLI